jgi:hypothetical protein
MATKKKDPIAEAKALLTASGYEVKAKRPEPKIGDVVRMYQDDESTEDVLITVHQTDSHSADDVWNYGGVVVARGKYDDLYTDFMWIDRNLWAKDDGDYEVVGHIDLTKYTKIH